MSDSGVPMETGAEAGAAWDRSGVAQESATRAAESGRRKRHLGRVRAVMVVRAIVQEGRGRGQLFLEGSNTQQNEAAGVEARAQELGGVEAGSGGC